MLRDLAPFIQIKKPVNTHGGVVLLVRLQVEACNFNKSKTPPWFFSRFLNCFNGTKSHNVSLSVSATCLTIAFYLPNKLRIAAKFCS